MIEILKKHEDKVRYLLVGGWNTVFGYLVFVGLYLWLHCRTHYLLLLVLSYIISITNAYIGYKFFVFKTKNNYLREYLRFYLVYGLSFLLNLLLLPLFVELFGLKTLSAQALTTLITIIVSYIGHKNFSFK